MSQEDLRAVSVMESTIRLRNGHYELALPWRNSPPRLPNNRPLAEHRLLLLKKRLLKDPDRSMLNSWTTCSIRISLEKCQPSHKTSPIK